MNRNAFRTQLTLDLDRAFAATIMNNAEKILVQHVREKSWNAAVSRKLTSKDPWPDAIPCVINLSALAKAIGCSRSHITRAKAALLADRIFVPLGEGVTINKNADEWAKARISARALEYARSAQAVQHPRGTGAKTVPDRAHPPVPESTHPDVPTQAHPLVSNREQGVSNRAHPCVQVGTPPVPGRAQPAPDAGRSKTGVPAPAREDVFSSSPELNSKTLLPPSTLEPRVGTTRLEKPPETMEELHGWVAATFGVKAIPPKSLDALAAGFRPSWVFHALRKASMDPEVKKPIAFAEACLQAWRKKGSCDAEVVNGSDCRYVPEGSGRKPGTKPVEIKAYWFNGKRLEKRA